MFINHWSITLLQKAIDYFSPKVNFNRLIVEYFLIIDPMYMYVCVCVCVCVCVYIHTYIYIYICVCVLISIFTSSSLMWEVFILIFNSFTFLTDPPKRKPIVSCMGKTIHIF